MESKLESGSPKEDADYRQDSIPRLARLVLDKKAPIVATSVLAVISSFLALLLPWLTEKLVESMSSGQISTFWILLIAISVILGGIVALSLPLGIFRPPHSNYQPIQKK